MVLFTREATQLEGTSPNLVFDLWPSKLFAYLYH